MNRSVLIDQDTPEHSDNKTRNRSNNITYRCMRVRKLRACSYTRARARKRIPGSTHVYPCMTMSTGMRIRMCLFCALRLSLYVSVSASVSASVSVHVSVFVAVWLYVYDMCMRLCVSMCVYACVCARLRVRGI